MRIMELYRIESEYKNHKQRLQSIKKLSSKQKISKLTTQHFFVTNELKKIKNNAESFYEKKESSRREQYQEKMNQTITDNHRRIKHQYESLGTFAKIQSGIKGFPSFEQSKIQHENHLLKEKIGRVQSVYKSIRRNSEYETLSSTKTTERQKTKRSEKDKLLELLKTQFKIQPRVVFPLASSNSLSSILKEVLDSPTLKNKRLLWLRINKCFNDSFYVQLLT